MSPRVKVVERFKAICRQPHPAFECGELFSICLSPCFATRSSTFSVPTRSRPCMPARASSNLIGRLAHDPLYRLLPPTVDLLESHPTRPVNGILHSLCTVVLLLFFSPPRRHADGIRNPQVNELFAELTRLYCGGGRLIRPRRTAIG